MSFSRRSTFFSCGTDGGLLERDRELGVQSITLITSALEQEDIEDNRER